MRFQADSLRRFASAVMQKAGLDKAGADLFADSLIEANLRGVDSHGITRLGIYTRRIEAGLIRSDAELKILRENASSYAFDAGDGVGAVMGRAMVERCMEKAAKTGCCVATAKNGTHWGAASFYTKYAAERGMIALAFCNSEAAVVPFGGAVPMLGTNPLSVAIPAGRHAPLVLDMATSTVARGKVVQANKEGRSIPDSWCVDENGQPTTDPAEALKGAMLPFGGPKGYAISLIIDMICASLGGSLNCRTTHHFWDDFVNRQNVGYFMLLIDVKSFLPYDEFCRSVDGIMDEIKACPPAPGVSSVMIPGEIEELKSAQNAKEGIALADSLVEELRGIGAAHGVAFPEA